MRDVYRASIHPEDVAGRRFTRLTTGLNASSLDFSVDGKQLIYSSLTPRANIWSVPITDKIFSAADARPVTSGNQSIEGVDISPDEQWIVFDSNRSGNADIYKMSRSGGQLEQLTNHPADDFGPKWSADGKWIAFHSFRNGNRDLFVMSADGSSVQQVTNDPAQERYANWSPDGKRIVFFSDKNGGQELFITSKDEKGTWETPRQLTKTGGVSPRWSPKGDAIVYFSNSHPGDVLEISPAGGEPKVLVHQPEVFAVFAAWSPDGSTLFYKGATTDRNDNDTIWSVPASGGTPTLRIRLDDPVKRSLRPEFTVDSHNIYFTMTERESDVWLMELKNQ